MEETQAAYDALRQCCPQCGGVEITRIYASRVYPGPDTNHAVCPCGWTGIADELRPHPPKE